MLSVEVLCVGKINQSSLNEILQDYCSRIGVFCKLKIIELSKFKGVTRNSSTYCLKFEETLILKKLLSSSSYRIALCIEGVELSSEEFADKICKVQNMGFSKISFIIGGAFGLSEEVKRISNFRMSFSKLTLPHKLVRLFLIEQIYRAMTILKNQPYHK